MFESFPELADKVKQMQPQDRSTAMVTWCIVESIYYIVLGLVVWSLGKRLLNVITLAYKGANK